MSRKKQAKSISLPFELPTNFDEWVAKALFFGKIALTSLVVSILVQLLIIKGIPMVFGKVKLTLSPNSYTFRLAHPLAIIMALYLQKVNQSYFRNQSYQLYKYVASLSAMTVISMWLLSGMVAKGSIFSSIPKSLYLMLARSFDSVVKLIV